METTTLSSKGQLVIPKSIRNDAHVSAGSLFEVRYLDGEIRLRALPPVAATALDEVAGCLARTGRKRVSDSQAQTIIKARLKARHAP
jgi:AbrB family looped-hinge helix DNA binding protein